MTINVDLCLSSDKMTQTCKSTRTIRLLAYPLEDKMAIAIAGI